MIFYFLHDFFRSSAIGLLQQIREKGSGLMDTIMLSMQHLETEHQVLAAGLLLQLDTLVRLKPTFCYETR